MSLGSRITGTGSAFPPTILTNDELSQRVETSNEWIVERTGIQERRIARPGDPEDYNSSIAYLAALRALEMAGKRPDEVDQILFATCSPDTLVPSAACWLQKKLQANRAFAMDLNAACSGFLYALTTADQFIRNGTVKTVLVVGSETLSSFTDWSDRRTCILFGDGAGAVVVEATQDSSHRIISSHLQSDGNLWDLFQIPAGGSAVEVTPENYEKKLHKMQMKGKELFKVAVKTLSHFAERAVTENNLTLSDIQWIVPHQANLRIIEAVAKRLDVPMDRFIVNIDRYGNTSAATVPTALDEAVRNGKIQSGDLVLLDVFGAGTTYGSLLMRW